MLTLSTLSVSLSLDKYTQVCQAHTDSQRAQLHIFLPWQDHCSVENVAKCIECLLCLHEHFRCVNEHVGGAVLDRPVPPGTLEREGEREEEVC